MVRRRILASGWGIEQHQRRGDSGQQRDVVLGEQPPDCDQSLCLADGFRVCSHGRGALTRSQASRCDEVHHRRY
jgi:hypothetical protein